MCLLRVLDDFKINEAQKLIREAETQEIPGEENKGYLIFFFNFYLFIYLSIFGCVGSSFLCEGFL